MAGLIDPDWTWTATTRDRMIAVVALVEHHEDLKSSLRSTATRNKAQLKKKINAELKRTGQDLRQLIGENYPENIHAAKSGAQRCLYGEQPWNSGPLLVIIALGLLCGAFISLYRGFSDLSPVALGIACLALSALTTFYGMRSTFRHNTTKITESVLTAGCVQVPLDSNLGSTIADVHAVVDDIVTDHKVLSALGTNRVNLLAERDRIVWKAIQLRNDLDELNEHSGTFDDEYADEARALEKELWAELDELDQEIARLAKRAYDYRALAFTLAAPALDVVAEADRQIEQEERKREAADTLRRIAGRDRARRDGKERA